MTDQTDAGNGDDGTLDTSAADTSTDHATEQSTDQQDDNFENADTGQSDETDDAQDDDLDDWEDDKGVVHRVPKELKRGFLRESDYTQKTQAIAERDRELAAVAERNAQHAQLLQANAAEIAQIGALDHRLKEFDTYFAEFPPAHQMTEQDLVEYQQARINYDQLKAQRDAAAGELAQKHTAAVEAQRQADATALSTMREKLTDKKTGIPGYSPALEQQIFAAATTDLGFSPEEIGRVRDPKIIKALHYASLGLKAERAARQKANTQKQQATKPSPQVRGQGGRFGTPADTDDFAAFDRQYGNS